ncbi:4Fe-4S dicluster domain-containing protein [Methanoregula sp.]|uniref:4Fe-4S dicluster domain-containing protein n=1 Tax=Methanoregula sp. TaxID=2052170 RepID=UPI00236E10FF|nr:4Fe-4S dicluster domain-containing protein [Methanoregula sp.]MDD1686676.1 4Fe-4S dicluster domain-containing protein [Methanoregula sp.]
MAFAVHIDMEHCTSCNNCVVACPVDTSELHTADPESGVCRVRGGESGIPDFRGQLCAGYGVCVQACPYGVIRIADLGSSGPVVRVQQETA